MAGSVFFIDVDSQLKEEAVLEQLLGFFDLRRRPRFNMDLRKNKTPFVGPTVITSQDELEIQWILQNLPGNYKTMLKGEPYARCSGWEAFRELMGKN